MSAKNLHLSGVGGQGIGLLADVLARACIAVGHTLIGCDTHGLAQRGGTVVSHLRLGTGSLSPRVPVGQADVVISLERLEAFRATETMLRQGGTVVYYDTVYQPMHVRLGLNSYPTVGDLNQAAEAHRARLERVFLEALPDPRMQNVALLGRVASMRLIENVTSDTIEHALVEALPPAVLEKNLAVFKQAAANGEN